MALKPQLSVALSTRLVTDAPNGGKGLTPSSLLSYTQNSFPRWGWRGVHRGPFFSQWLAVQ